MARAVRPPTSRSQAREILRENDIIRGILVKHTGQDDERIRKDFDRDFYMNPEQAKAYGMIDEILTQPRSRPLGPVI